MAGGYDVEEEEEEEAGFVDLCGAAARGWGVVRLMGSWVTPARFHHFLNTGTQRNDATIAER